jgi:hypothetical protein
VTADAALDLGEALGTSARLWMNLQSGNEALTAYVIVLRTLRAASAVMIIGKPKKTILMPRYSPITHFAVLGHPFQIRPANTKLITPLARIHIQFFKEVRKSRATKIAAAPSAVKKVVNIAVSVTMPRSG